MPRALGLAKGVVNFWLFALRLIIGLILIRNTNADTVLENDHV